MRVLIADDEPLALEDSHEIVKQLLPNAEIVTMNSMKKCLDLINDDRSNDISTFDIAFLDIEMPGVRGMNGIELARKLQDINPRINIIFVTAFSQYAIDAYNLYVSDYCLKPLMEDKVKCALRNLRYKLNDDDLKIICGEITPEEKIYIDNNGVFIVLNYERRRIIFRRRKSEELLHILADNIGNDLTSSNICIKLWGEYTETTRNYFWKITSDLRMTLQQEGLENVLLQSRNSYALDSSRVEFIKL